MRVVAIQATWRARSLPTGTCLQPICMVIDFEHGMIRWEFVVDVHQVVAQGFTGTVGEVTTRIGSDKGTESTCRLHVALKAYVFCKGRRKIRGIQYRVADLLVSCISRVGKIDMGFTGSMASLASYAVWKFRRECIRLTEHVTADGN